MRRLCKGHIPILKFAKLILQIHYIWFYLLGPSYGLPLSYTNACLNPRRECNAWTYTLILESYTFILEFKI